MNVAVIPARGGSKRIPRKNIKFFCGKPIIAYSIETAISSELFDKVIVSTDDKEVIKDYSKTDAFHKELNKAIKDKMTFEKMPEFLKWYCFEAMSGVKKFSNPTSVASICATFDPKTGKVTTINVTKDGKKSGLKGNPTVSTEVENLAKKIKIFAAWKSAGKNPRSVLRLTSSYEPENTLRGIMLDELYKDQYTKSCIQELNEETDQLDEFAIIRKAMDKVKSLAGRDKKWISGKVMY